MSNSLRGSSIGLGCKGGSRHQLTGPAYKVGTRLSVGAWTVARATASIAETFASCHTGCEPVERTGDTKNNKKRGEGGTGDEKGAAIRTERVAEGRKKGEPERRRGEENKCERTQRPCCSEDNSGTKGEGAVRPQNAGVLARLGPALYYPLTFVNDLTQLFAVIQGTVFVLPVLPHMEYVL